VSCFILLFDIDLKRYMENSGK